MGVVGLLFLGVNRADKLDVGDILELIARNFRFLNKLDGIGAIDASPHTLCEVSKFVGSRNVPGLFEFGVS